MNCIQLCTVFTVSLGGNRRESDFCQHEQKIQVSHITFLVFHPTHNSNKSLADGLQGLYWDQFCPAACKLSQTLM